MQELDIFDSASSALAVYTPLDSLFSEYRKKRADIERIAQYVAGETNVMAYFMSGAGRKHNFHSLSAAKLFSLEPTIHALDAAFWSRAMSLTDVLEVMPAEMRNNWNKQIHDHETPTFDPTTVRATLDALLVQRTEFFADRIEGIFRELSDEHLTNKKYGFSQRMILNYMLDYTHLSRRKMNYIHDLRAVIARFAGRPEAHAQHTYSALEFIHENGLHGTWHSFDGGAFQVRLYKKGTAHVLVHEMLAYRLNQVLAWRNPAAIPSELRRPPTKPKQDVPLRHDLIAHDVLIELENINIARDGLSASFRTPALRPTEEVLAYIGGVRSGFSFWEFDYQVEPVIREILRTGTVPDYRSHNFFPTGERMARLVVELADIQDEDEILEPEAGQAGIAQFLPPERTTCVEISKLHCGVLIAKGYTTICTDFLTWNPGKLFRKIVMNPPFSAGRAVDHVKHAATLLHPDGKLVAIMPASAYGKTLVDGWAHEWAGPYPGEFVGTSVSVSVVVLKPAR